VLSATQWGALECINAGITTLVDWAHIMNTPDHADASVQALQDTGIRSVFAYGFPNTSLVDWWFGPDYTGSVLTSDGDEARRLRSQYFSSDDARITMGLATRGPGFCKPEVVQHDWELAKELDIDITVHVAMDRFGYTKGQITALRDMDLLYPGTTYVHASHFTDEEWQLVADSGGNVSFAPQIEIQMGHGWAPAVTAVEYGVPIGLSSDVATTASADQFTQMHAVFGSERGRKHQEAWDVDLDGLEASPGLITARDTLAWATIGGAEVAGIADRTGSLTPGKRADLILVRTGEINVAPMSDPYQALVSFAQPGNIEMVVVDGRILRRGGAFTALDHAEVIRQAAECAAMLRARANWT
jgi:cytosine/adenosine deaminase-related metal-dependent hydrolase